jgi:phosphoribosylaminoimidazolecarboxamide formyltransferase / IMP cyclohydrolase
MTTDSPLPVRRALLSASDKTGLADFARALAERGAEIVSTGGTAQALRDAGLAVTEVADITGFPEVMGGRVKTLHPRIHGGILARRGQDDATLAEHGIGAIDLVAVTLYPFEGSPGIETIDVGGPAMIRAAAKNHAHVAVATDPADYTTILADLAAHGGTTVATRARLAAGAFARTAAYDAAIADWMTGPEALTPPRVALTGVRAAELRYGENPHQRAALYHTPADTRPGPARATQVQGKQLSYNNLLDADAAFALVSEFTDGPAVAIVKHANPCGVATDRTILNAYARALACDPVSAFGGIVAVNRPLDAATAAAIVERFVEVIVAPSVEAEALDVLATRKNVRVLTTGAMADPSGAARTFRHIIGGLLVQDWDAGRVDADDLQVVSDREPTARERADMLFAWRVAKHVTSNAIVYAKAGATVGIGAGQMSRVDAARIAAAKAREAAEASGADDVGTRGAVVASDAFFPFADGLLEAAAAGVTAVIQPGGSVRDAEVIEAANDRGLAMVFTGMRHFRT